MEKTWRWFGKKDKITLPAQDWTAKKAWGGADFPKGHAIRN
jgi:hypothetical protein